MTALSLIGPSALRPFGLSGTPDAQIDEAEVAAQGDQPIQYDDVRVLEMEHEGRWVPVYAITRDGVEYEPHPGCRSDIFPNGVIAIRPWNDKIANVHVVINGRRSTEALVHNTEAGWYVSDCHGPKDYAVAIARYDA